MTRYDLEYKGVTCVAVDWEADPPQFVFKYKGFTIGYVQKRYISQSADTDHIRCAIEQFLEDYMEKYEMSNLGIAGFEQYSELSEPLPEPNVGNCKRCVNKHNCGNKNKREASWCERYRPRNKNKRRKERR